jgi:hypothetical protein
MSYKKLLADLADRILQLSRTIAEKANIPNVQEFEHDRGWLMQQINKLPPPQTVWILDNRYRTTTLDGFRTIAQWDATNLRQYITDFWDCDDYAWRFKSNTTAVFLINSVGFVIDVSDPKCAHSYNILFTEDSGPLVYEPQTDDVMSIDEARQYCTYKMDYYVLVV